MGHSGKLECLFFYPEGRSYLPPRHRKIRSAPFPLTAKTAFTTLRFLFPTKQVLRGSLGGGISYGEPALITNCPLDTSPRGGSQFHRCNRLCRQRKSVVLVRFSACKSKRQKIKNNIRKRMKGDFVWQFFI